jgi:hypothetical protein
MFPGEFAKPNSNRIPDGTLRPPVDAELFKDHAGTGLL